MTANPNIDSLVERLKARSQQLTEASAFTGWIGHVPEHEIEAERQRYRDFASLDSEAASALEEVRRDLEATEAVRDEYGEDLIAKTFELQSCQAEIARLREALKPFAAVSFPDDWPDEHQPIGSVLATPTVGQFRRARSALERTE